MKQNSKLHLTVDNISLDNVQEHKLLGVYIDNHLKWQPQINYVCKKLNSKITLLKHVYYYLTDEMRQMYYNAYILPIFDYCCHIWGKDNKSHIKRVKTLQTRTAKIILKLPKYSSTTNLFKKLNWLSFTERCKYHCDTLTFKILNGKAPSYMSELLTIAANNHYSLRSISNQSLILKQLPKTNYYKDSFTYYSTKTWNEISKDIRNSDSLNNFKRRYKSFLMTK